MATDQFTSVALRATGLLVVAFLCLSVLAVRFRKIFGGLRLATKMKGPLIAVSVLTLLSPFPINGVAFVHIRFGFAMVALFLAATT